MKFISLFVGNLLLLLVFIGFSAWMILNPNVMSGFTLEDYSNDYCQSGAAPKDLIDPLSLVCNNQYKKEKFIWIILNSEMARLLHDLPNEKDKLGLTNLFDISPKQNNQKSPLYESMITGKFSRNYAAKPTMIDSFFRQANLNQHLLHFIGADYPMANLLDHEKAAEMKKRNQSSAPPELFNSNLRNSVLYVVDQSPPSNNPDMQTIHLLLTTKNITGLFDWINLHSEYALIVSSDQRSREYHFEECNGCIDVGSAGMLFVSTKELRMNHKALNNGREAMTIESIAPTLAQILKDVNIPLEAQGIPYYLGNDNILRYAATKSKEIQLRQFINKYLLKHPNKKSLMAPFIEKLDHNDYSLKVTDLKSMNQMDEFFYYNYISFLQQTQKELLNSIHKDFNSFFSSLVLYGLILFVIIKLLAELKQVKTIISIQPEQKVNQALLAMIVFSLLFEVFIAFAFDSYPFERVISATRIGLFMLLFFIGVFYFMLFGFERRFFTCIVFALYSIGALAVGFFNFAWKLQVVFAQSNNRFLLNSCVNYPLALVYLFVEIRALNRIYIDPKLKVKVTLILYGISILMLSAMMGFDKGNSQSQGDSILKSANYSIMIYSLIVILIILSFKRLRKKIPFDPKTKEPTQIVKVKSQILIKFPIFFLVFLISSETERLMTLICFLPAYYFFLRLIRKTKNMYWKLLCFVFLLAVADLLYLLSGNSFSFEIPSKVMRQYLGKSVSDTSIASWLFIGMHKMKLFIFAAAHFIGVAYVSKWDFMKNESFMTRLALDAQLALMVCLYFYYLIKRDEEKYYHIFIWILTKSVICVFFDVIVLIWYFVLHSPRKVSLDEDLVAPGQNVEQVIEMEETTKIE